MKLNSVFGNMWSWIVFLVICEVEQCFDKMWNYIENREKNKIIKNKNNKCNRRNGGAAL